MTKPIRSGKMTEPNGMKVTIVPLKRQVMDEATAERTWKILENAIHHIYEECPSALSLEYLYRKAYKMVHHNYGARLYRGLVETMKQQLQKIALTVESEKGGLHFLEEVHWQWSRHKAAVLSIRTILEYMERSYAPRNHRAKIDVFIIGLVFWRNLIMRSPKIRDRMLDALHDVVHRERTGEPINRRLMGSITFMMDNFDPPVYSEEFERKFLDSATEFYRLESLQYIQNGNCSEYLTRAEKRFREEVERTLYCLRPRTGPKILAVVEREMISNHVRVLAEMENSGLVAMVISDKYDDLRRMYDLFRLVSPGLQIIQEVMFNYLRKTGRELIMDPVRLKDPVGLVQRLLAEKDKFDNIIQLSFYNSRSFQNALNSAFEYFMNLNRRCPELISLFLDEKFCKGFKDVSDQEAETVLDKVVILFRYLQDKDVFGNYYKRHLAKRLLARRSLSDDVERSMIMKLRTECGFQFTSKLEGMLTDMKTSEDTLHDFKALLSRSEAASEGAILAVQVLTKGSWPIPSGAKCNLPTEILTMCDKFTAYYLSTHNGRRLSWQTNLGTVDLNSNFGNGQKHELKVSTYQMCVLMLFNMVDTLSYDEIQQATDIPPQDLKQNLQLLACASEPKVLKKEPMSRDVSETDVFHFNDRFSSKSYKVKIRTVAARMESATEMQKTTRKVEEDRIPQIDAVIVKIMKSRQVMDHNNLISEITQQLQASFLPSLPIIKKRIESLMEREFLKRDEDDSKLYRYLA